MVDFASASATELLGILDSYPWFTAARAALCLRTMQEAGAEAAEGVIRDALPYLPAGSLPVVQFMALGREDSFKDASLAAEANAAPRERRVMVAGMDYFSKEEYESARFDIDARLSQIAVVDYSTAPAEPAPRREEEQYDFVTETLAQIYAEQGYTDKAIEIYTKLSLQSPEKNVYFASLIDKLKN